MSLALIVIALLCAIDLLAFFICIMKELSTGFTWVCYPFWFPLNFLGYNGLPMFSAMIIRLIEVVFIIVGALTIGTFIA